MKVPRRRRRHPSLVYALYINAGLLLAILLALLLRGNGLGTPAYGAQQMVPIAGGGGVFLMPAQFSVNTWGCYLFDIDTQNICAYQYYPSERQLRFVAARNYREDRRVKDWNTSPHPAEIARLNALVNSEIRGQNPEATPLPPVPFPTPTPDTANDKPGPAAPGDSTKPGEVNPGLH